MAKGNKRMVKAGGLKLAEDELVTLAGASTAETAARRLNEIIASMLEYHRNRDGDVDAVIMDAMTSLKALAPRDEVESMLSTQMISTHLAAMECLKRAALPDQTFEGRQSGLNHAQKLMSLYLRQVETLDKHRGKGQQTITVEHVNVEAGGQAIVGNVNTGGPAGANTQGLKHNPGQTAPVIDADVPAEAAPVKTERSGKTNQKPRKRS